VIRIGFVEWRRPEDSAGGDVSYFSPIIAQRFPRALTAAGRETISQCDRVKGAGAGCRDALEGEPRLFEQPIEHAPGESAVTSATLQSKVDALLTRRSRAR
jgi:hypothetical protein